MHPRPSSSPATQATSCIQYDCRGVSPGRAANVGCVIGEEVNVSVRVPRADYRRVVGIIDACSAAVGAMCPTFEDVLRVWRLHRVLVRR